MRRFAQICGAASLVTCLLLWPSAATRGSNDDPGIRGFAPSRVSVERALEQKFQSLPDPARAESDLRHLTSEPHVAGTEGSHRVALWLLDQYRSYGFDAEIVTYSAWISLPRQIKLELTAPVQKVLATSEEPYAADPDTLNPHLLPAFNAYSPSGDVTGQVVYVNYGAPEDYRTLDSLGISVEGKIVLARYGRIYRGIKTRLAEQHKALGLILYSDPADDGFAMGDVYPNGAWRPMSGIQRGSVLYTQIYPGDPLTPVVSSPSGPDPIEHIEPADAADLPRIPTMPINAQDAEVILSNLRGGHAPREWQGALSASYRFGPGPAQVHMKIAMDFAERPIYDVIARLHGANDNEWVLLGNHHDAWVYGAADPGSGTAAMLETARSLGELVRAGWKPRRTIVMCHWDAEEPGLIGSTKWVEAHRAELQAKAIAYINADVGVTGPNFAAAATPSLQQLVRDAARSVTDPNSGRSVYAVWRENYAHSPEARDEQSAAARAAGPGTTLPGGNAAGAPNDVPVGALGAGSDFCPFLDYSGVPSIDLGFNGEYGVYHSLYDDFYWMKHFGDPAFTYHAALARILGTLALRLDESDLLPVDVAGYASGISRSAAEFVSRAKALEADPAALKVVADASSDLSSAAGRASQALHSLSDDPLGAAREDEINRAVAGFDQALLAPGGLPGRPWYEHIIFAPGSNAGYDAELFPGVTEAFDRGNAVQFRQQCDALAAAFRRAAARLDEIARLAQPASSSATTPTGSQPIQPNFP
ncbi:MAG TPA: M28 family metallopeptidase [Candidatus Acidoferrales bacterium]|nr:M28 family metallopeptidase [Candidatus Acidoferrales bacterium]